MRNRPNPRVTIHRSLCGHLRKHGGEHKYGQGKYMNHDTFAQAVAYANTTGLPVKECSFCKPG